MDNLFLIAEVKNIFIDGSVSIKSFSDFSKRFSKLEKVVIRFFGKIKELDVEFTKKNDNTFIIKFRRFDSAEDVHFLIGKKLYVYKEDLVDLPCDTYYIHDLIDSNVYLGSMFFGKLVDVLKLPNNDVYVIKKDEGKEILIPAVKKFIFRFERVNKKLFLDKECEMFIEDEN